MGTLPSRSARCHRPPARNAGFTLIELLIASVASGVVAVVLLGLFSSHLHVARVHGAREDARQNARSALELIVSELRSVAPGGLAAAERDGLEFRMPRAWGLVCSHTSERLAVLFPTVAAPLLQTGEEHIALPARGDSLEAAHVAVFDSTGYAGPRAQAHALCAELQHGVPLPPAGAGPARMYTPREPGATLGILPGADGLPPGTPVHLFDRVRYEVARPSGSEHFWIRRNTGPAMLMHPLAGPVPEVDGLRFRYFDGDGREVEGPLDRHARSAVRTIAVRLVTKATSGTGGTIIHDSAAALVHLRNRD
jgi:prepilin-type N-terminal cleavage/methylation domain-containing protein